MKPMIWPKKRAENGRSGHCKEKVKKTRQQDFGLIINIQKIIQNLGCEAVAKLIRE